MKNACNNVLIALLCVFSNWAYAEVRWYQVELVVFAQSGKSNETFNQTSSRIEWPQEVGELGGAPLPLADLRQFPQVYVTLQSADWSLAAADQTLHLQGGYRPLLHVAWVQPLEEGLAGHAVHVHGGGRPGEGDVLNGFVQIENGDQFYLLADLEYTPATQDAENIVYRLREKRLFRLDEVHYLDHPKFGVISRVSPLQ